MKLLRLTLFACALLCMQRAAAQCTYTLNMFDAFGDGWNGGYLIIKTGNMTDTIGMDNISGDGVDSTVHFAITSGVPLTMIWVSGFYDSEASFQLLNNDGTLLFKDTIPGAGIVYSDTAACISCLKPAGLTNVNIYDKRAKLRWTPLGGGNPAGWWVIYGPKGFVPGPGMGDTVYVTEPKVTLTGLMLKTWYDWYVVQDCGGGDHSLISGPVSFETYWTNDVGIVGVTAPVSGCNLGLETVKIVMKNFGAAPQTLIPFKYSVNGIDAGVSQPQDGYYTGVIGKDSTEEIPFETLFDFSAPGEYLITVYTQLMGDQDTLNDTFSYRIVNRLTVPYKQDFETWTGGWYVDTLHSHLSSWAFGKPVKPLKQVIDTAASGVNIWVTNLEGFYNVGELSYLHSPCFDFSDITSDPIIQFSLNTDMDSSFDGAFLEYTLNDTLWNRVGALGQGLHWYNKTFPFSSIGDAWTGKTGGWIAARHRLTGLAGKSGVHLRFGFVSGSTFFAGGDGIGVDDIQVYLAVAKDFSGQEVTTVGDATLCGMAKDSVKFTIANLGSATQNLFKLAYSINGGAPVVENVVHVLTPDQTFTYKFHTPFDSRDGLFHIKCWTLLNGEQAPSNDTVSYTVDHRPHPVPFLEDFEAGVLPAGWQASAGFVSNGHNNTSHVYGLNMYFGVDTFTLDLPRFGVIGATDSLRFDYRITNWSPGTVATILKSGTKMYLQASTDCGQSYQNIYTIDSLTHIVAVPMRKIKLGLSQFAGQSIRLRFTGRWTAGDFWFDLDNINIRTCPADMNLSAQTFPTSPTGNTGKAIITVGLGNPPYSYHWSTGTVLPVPVLTNLAAGTYTVTVIDGLGCSSTLTVTIDVATGVHEIEGLTMFSLHPNPTRGLLLMNATFDHPVDAALQVLNLLGEDIWETRVPGETSLSEQIDLTPYPTGLYLVRLTVEGQTVVRKIVKSDR